MMPPAERIEGYWLVLDYENNPPIRLDVRILDRIFVDDVDLVVSVDDVTIRIAISGGAELARTLAEQLAQRTRAAPITCRDVYDDAKRRLAGATRGGTVHGSSILLFGNDIVRASDELLYVGANAYWLSDVEHYALEGREIPLPNGRMQAALASLVVADRNRVEDPHRLSERIAEYEKKLCESDDR